MTDAEVALELTKIILNSRKDDVRLEDDPKKVILSAYREALSAVRAHNEA